jgi:hypothetical protein
LKEKVSGSGLENREYGTLYPQKLAITSPTSGGRLVGIDRSRTQTMEFSFFRRGDVMSDMGAADLQIM